MVRISVVIKSLKKPRDSRLASKAKLSVLVSIVLFLRTDFFMKMILQMDEIFLLRHSPSAHLGPDSGWVAGLKGLVLRICDESVCDVMA